MDTVLLKDNFNDGGGVMFYLTDLYTEIGLSTYINSGLRNSLQPLRKELLFGGLKNVWKVGLTRAARMYSEIEQYKM